MPRWVCEAKLRETVPHHNISHIDKYNIRMSCLFAWIHICSIMGQVEMASQR